MSAKEGRDLFSRVETVSKNIQRFQALVIKLSNLIYESAESFFQFKNNNITYNTELWNDDYNVLLLSSYSRYLETNTKILFLSLKHLIYL